MKALIVVLSTLLFSVNLFAQNGTEETEKPRNNEFKVGFFQFFGGAFQLSYEHSFKNNSSIVLEGTANIVKNESKENLGGKGELQYRFYFPPKHKSKGFSYEGIYTGPYALYGYLDTKEYNNYVYDEFTNESYYKPYHNFFSYYSAGILFGVKFAIAQKITMDINFGGGIKYADEGWKNANEKRNYNIFSAGYSGVIPKGNFTFGIKF